ncbi:hypothetical protein [Massilia horti]|uniref:Uncharacterized protein n=1 Tax=Massilia horti TaxID=2562153 RepID=A0A4Y9T176_9BURK|nr:hypothetical protein [Massilia horti]TFW32647.1 hypothetical protein E4O92_09215 [Massilia horti]
MRGGTRRAPHATRRQRLVHIRQGYNDQHPLQLTLKDVVVDGDPKVKIEFARLKGQLNSPDSQPLDCSKRFAPFPEAPQAPPAS